MEINRLDLIKKLRAMTQAGFSLCAEALDATKNNLEEAVRWLRQRGMAKAEKKADRVTNEGLTGAITNGNRAVLYQLQCETDFVSRNQDFQNFFKKVGETILQSKCTKAEQVPELKQDEQTLSEALLELSGKIGEKISFGQIIIFEKEATDLFGFYIHGQGKSSGVVVLSGTNNQSLADQIAMHIVAMRPHFLNLEAVSEEYRTREMASIKAALAERDTLTDKNPEMVEKIILGKLNKQLSEITLLSQKNIHNEKETIAQTLNREKAVVKKMGWVAKGD